MTGTVSIASSVSRPYEICSLVKGLDEQAQIQQCLHCPYPQCLFDKAFCSICDKPLHGRQRKYCAKCAVEQDRINCRINRRNNYNLYYRPKRNCAICDTEILDYGRKYCLKCRVKQQRLNNRLKQRRYRLRHNILAKEPVNQCSSH